MPFLTAIPDEIQEAAYDRRLRPPRRSSGGWCCRSSLPGVITVGILAFIGSWNGYLLPLFILNDEAQFTLPLGVQAFSSQYSVDTAKVLAFTSLSMLPALVFFSALRAAHRRRPDAGRSRDERCVAHCPRCRRRVQSPCGHG